MIYVMCGLEKFPFIRLVQWMDQAALEGKINEPVIVQAGTTVDKYQPKSKLLEVFSTVTHTQQDKYIDSAKQIVMHAGVGSFLQVRAAGKFPIIVPRQHKLGEHLDDHQLELVRTLKKEFALPYVETYEDILEMLNTDFSSMQIKSFRNELVTFLDSLVEPV